VGRTLGWLGHHSSAAGHFESAIESRPQHLLAYYLLGWSNGKLGLYERAISTFDRALKMAPDRAYPHAHKALCHMYLGRYQEAAYGFERAFRIEPRYRTLPLFADSLARCQSNLGQNG
jgi:tetratricopeptide (TPR) repeat protein